MGQDVAMSSRAIDIDPACSRDRRDVHDPFFLKGYQLAFEGTVYYVEDCEREGASPAPNQEEEYAETATLFPCGVCSLSFASMTACDAHYEESHIFQCNECHATLPSDRLLDLHLQEAHDSYFSAAVDRGLRKFTCLVCENEFDSCQDRLVHLTEFHGYPKWFRFIAKARAVEDDTKKKLKWMEQRSKLSSKADASMEEDPNIRKQERRARQKAKRASVACKFHHTKGGCWRGDKCMFLHSDQMDDLSMQLSTKAKVSVPENLSFGRRRR